MNRRAGSRDKWRGSLQIRSMQYWIVSALCVVAFALASLAVQSWRELLALAVLSAVLIVPVKWIAAGTWFAADSLTFHSEPWKVSFAPSGAFVASIILASIVMILTRHVVLTLQSKKDRNVSQ
ncbi:MAG: hypothetical protein ACJ8E1_12240 [Xanthobacteraceae bacterium]